MPDQSPNDSVAADAPARPGREATAGPEVPQCSSVPSVVNEFPKQEESAGRSDLTTLRADLKSLVINNLLASPLLTRFYVDSTISNFPNSNAAKILARNYQKIMNRISMPNPKSCTHIKVTGVRCQAPALRGEQFCYFHQHAHRGVRRPAHSRLHPIALIESEEAIQASLMEVINGLIRNTLDVKRAELIIRALHIAVKNARNTRFDSNVYPKVREVPEYFEPETGNVNPGAINADEYLPAVAAVPYKPVDHAIHISWSAWKRADAYSPARPPNTKPPKQKPHRPSLPLLALLMWGQPPPAVPVAKRPHPSPRHKGCPTLRAFRRLGIRLSIPQNESRR